MLQEDKKLLIKDLCARLPYGVKFHYFPDEGSKGVETIGTATCWDGDVQCVETDKEGFNVENIKLYLRPIDSITEEEYKELSEVYNHGETHHVVLPQNDERHHATLCMISNGTIDDWLNEHHFDHRGLIPKGLALEAKEGMYKTE